MIQSSHFLIKTAHINKQLDSILVLIENVEAKLTKQDKQLCIPLERSLLSSTSIYTKIARYENVFMNII